MQVANPIYDVVFKYLLDDEKVARLLLSALLGQEVLELEFRPTELRHEAPKPDGTQLLVLRLDFAAAVRTLDGGRKLVLIEIQKARNALDVERFRRYLGTSYASPESFHVEASGQRQPLPLLTIYFLGEGLPGVEVPILDINRHYRDRTTGEILRFTDPFVEALTHDALVVSINRLKGRRRSELEQLLEIFDQDMACRPDPHLLDILEENFPERYREVLRRLMRAGVEPSIRDGMTVEDDIVASFKEQARESSNLRQIILKQDEILAEKDRALAEKDRALEDLQRQVAALKGRPREA